MSLLRGLRALPSLLQVGFAEMLAYRAELVIWFLTASLPLVMLLVWDRVAEGGPVQGFDQAGFAAYFTATLVVRQLAGSWVVWELNQQIRDGSLSSALLKPLHPLWFMACENLGDKPLRLLVLIPVVALLWAWRPAMSWPLDPGSLALFFLSLGLAWALSFLVQVSFGALAFHLDQSLGIWQLWFGLWALGSGYLFPLELLPPQALRWVELLPFPAMLATPVGLATGRLQGGAALAALTHQAVWLALAAALAAWTWRSGVRRYEAFGA